MSVFMVKGILTHTYLAKDLSSILSPFHVHGAKGDPWGTLGVVVVVRLVLIL